MTSTDPLGGQLWLRPGTPVPHNLHSTRPDWVARISHGQPADRLPGLLGSLYALCGHAHVLCASLAVAAAQGQAEATVSRDQQRQRQRQLARQTLNEHLRRLWLDWPRLLRGPTLPAAAADALVRVLAGSTTRPGAGADAGSAVSAGGAGAEDAAHWLQTHLIGEPLDRWLRVWTTDPEAALARLADGPGAAWLQPLLTQPASPAAAMPALLVQSDAHSLRTWAAGLQQGGPESALGPQWRGGCAETGPWTRLHLRDAQPPGSLRLRLAARLAEAVRLALPDEPACSGAGWLQTGALALGPGDALAWVEMSRGLLLHRVVLDGHGSTARVAHCQVVAPTDWNFHPRGAVAQALARMPRPEPLPPRPSTAPPPLAAPAAAWPFAAELGLLLAAYDACVPCVIDRSTQPDEATHA